MNLLYILIPVAAGLLLAAVLRVRYELRHFTTTYYDIGSEKISEQDGLRAVLLSDLHGRSYGEDDRELFTRVAEEKPDVILLAGDMITAVPAPEFEKSREVLEQLTAIAPVYASYGNHEKKLSLEECGAHPDFLAYQKALEEAGVTWLVNSGVPLNDSISVYGLDIDLKYYRKIKRFFYEPEQMKQDLASVREECFNIILAHNPRFFRTYAEYGADLYLSGHYHGGAIRIAGKIGIISPQFRPFPRYSKGLYQKGETRMIVSAGCGSHKVNLRLFNKPEIVVIDLHGNRI